MNIFKRFTLYAFLAMNGVLAGCANVDVQKDMAYGWIGGDFINSQNASWVQFNEDYAVSVAHLKRVEGQTEYISRDVDMQFLKRTSSFVPRWSEYQMGERVTMMGWPKTYGEEKIVKGVITEQLVVRFESDYAASYPMVTASIVKGMSGGPVLNEKREVLGINVGYSIKDTKVNGQPTAWSLFLPYSEIKKEWEKFIQLKTSNVK